MTFKKNLLLALVLVPLLAACEVGGIQLATPAVFCEADGEQYQPGETVPQADGCNTCICSSSGELEACTEMACTGMANPAAVNCSVKGFSYEIREDADGGQYGVCIDEENNECDAWAFFREECSLGSTPAEPEPEVAVEEPASEPEPEVSAEEPVPTEETPPADTTTE